jgi:hypothetical protein
MSMRLGDADHASESSLRQLAIADAIPDLREQPKLRVLEGQAASPRISIGNRLREDLENHHFPRPCTLVVVAVMERI